MKLNQLQRQIVRMFYEGQSCHNIARELKTYVVYVEDAIRAHYEWVRGNLVEYDNEGW